MGVMADRHRMIAAGMEAANLYRGGDKTFTLFQKVENVFELSPGTYSFYASVTTTDTDASSNLVLFYQASPNESGTVSLVMTRQKGIITGTVTFTKVIRCMALYASDNYTHSLGKTATFSNIRIEKIG